MSATKNTKFLKEPESQTNKQSDRYSGRQIDRQTCKKRNTPKEEKEKKKTPEIDVASVVLWRVPEAAGQRMRNGLAVWMWKGRGGRKKGE